MIRAPIVLGRESIVVGMSLEGGYDESIVM